MASQPRADLNLRLLHARDWRLAFHRPRASHPRDGFLQRKLTPIADFPFELGVVGGSVLVLLVVTNRHDTQSINLVVQRDLCRKTKRSRGTNAWFHGMPHYCLRKA